MGLSVCVYDGILDEGGSLEVVDGLVGELRVHVVGSQPRDDLDVGGGVAERLRRGGGGGGGGES